jgi:hypothetical protein
VHILWSNLRAILAVFFFITTGAGAFTLSSPVPADLQQVLAAPETQWRDPVEEVYRWESFPDILIIDTASFSIQDRMFTRLAYFTEKKGFRGRLLTNAELDGRHGWNAHDYGAEALSAFFNAAAAAGFPMNPEEIALRALAVDECILREESGRFLPAKGGVLALCRSSSAIERRLLLAHESFHGIFFSSEEYRQFCFTLWDSLPTSDRAFYRAFLDSLGYDAADRYLVVNEFQAYLMQQPLDYAASYFERFMKRFAEEGSPRAITAQRLLQSARALDQFLRNAFGISAGGTILASLGKAESAQ